MISALAGWLFDPSGLTPHGFCLLWEPWLIWTHALSNAAIGAAYFSIPPVLVRFIRRRRDLVFKPVFGLFAAFILLCGARALRRHRDALVAGLRRRGPDQGGHRRRLGADRRRPLWSARGRHLMLHEGRRT